MLYGLKALVSQSVENKIEFLKKACLGLLLPDQYCPIVI